MALFICPCIYWGCLWVIVKLVWGSESFKCDKYAKKTKTYQGANTVSLYVTDRHFTVVRVNILCLSLSCLNMTVTLRCKVMSETFFYWCGRHLSSLYTALAVTSSNSFGMNWRPSCKLGLISHQCSTWTGGNHCTFDHMVQHRRWYSQS